MPSSGSARFALEILRRYENGSTQTKDFTPKEQDMIAAAYPALQVRLVASESQGCETQGNGLVEAVRQSLGRVASVSTQPGM